MEKQSGVRTVRFIKRLLALLFLFGFLTNNLFGAIFESLEFTPSQNQNFLINTDIKFEVTIPEILPTEIQIIHDDITKQENVTFKSMKKFENYEDGGTKIEILYNFETEDTYSLPPIKATISKEEGEIRFPAIKIEENPAKMMPRIVIIFSNGVKIKSDDALKDKPIFKASIGEKLTFKVYLQYIKQLVHLTFDIPQNSIYKELKTYEIGEIKDISNRLIPVADFQWTGLESGIQPIPKFKITAISYGGYKTELMLPEFKVEFITPEPDGKIAKDDKFFEEAFADPLAPLTEDKVSENIKISEKDWEELAVLYSKERNSFFSGKKYKKQRIALEEKLGIPISKSPFTINRGFLFLFILAVIIFVALLILSIRKRFIFRVFLFSILLFLSSILLIFAAYRRSQNYGISRNCIVYSIPEKNAEASYEIALGNLVKITEETGNWLHLQLGETSGWCSKENIIKIE